MTQAHPEDSQYRLQAIMLAAQGTSIQTQPVRHEGKPQLRTTVFGETADVTGHSRYDGWISIEDVRPHHPDGAENFDQALQDAVHNQLNLRRTPEPAGRP